MLCCNWSWSHAKLYSVQNGPGDHGPIACDGICSQLLSCCLASLLVSLEHAMTYHKALRGTVGDTCVSCVCKCLWWFLIVYDCSPRLWNVVNTYIYISIFREWGALVCIQRTALNTKAAQFMAVLQLPVMTVLGLNNDHSLAGATPPKKMKQLPVTSCYKVSMCLRNSWNFHQLQIWHIFPVGFHGCFFSVSRKQAEPKRIPPPSLCAWHRCIAPVPWRSGWSVSDSSRKPMETQKTELLGQQMT